MFEGATRYRAALLVTALSVLVTAGCGTEPTRVQVAGQVRLDGKPLEAGEIQFVPTEGRPALAAIESEGRFELNSATVGDTANAGIVPGEYKVAVSTVQVVDDEVVTWVAPQKYANHLTSGIEVVIDQATNSLMIELASKEGVVEDEPNQQLEQVETVEPVTEYETEGAK